MVRFIGRQIRIRDLGRVVWSNKERQITTRTDGRESVQLEVFKEGAWRSVAVLKSNTTSDITKPWIFSFKYTLSWKFRGWLRGETGGPEPARGGA